MREDELVAYAAAEHAAHLANLMTKYKDAQLAEPQLWAPGEVEETQKQVAAAANAIPKSPQYARRANKVEDEEAADLSDPLAHIRELILSDFPQAGTATDEELEALYDEWAAQHGE